MDDSDKIKLHEEMFAVKDTEIAALTAQNEKLTAERDELLKILKAKQVINATDETTVRAAKVIKADAIVEEKQ